MTKRVLAVLLLVAMLVAPAHALRRFGDVNKDFRFNRLEINKTSAGRCVIRGQLENRTKETMPRVYFHLTATDRDGDILWDVIIIESFGPGQTVDFQEPILDCDRETNPWNLTWEVTR
ncbi:MAG: hypothetical protein ACLFQQ_18800 [Desulfococcaceae bacterium]